MRLRMARRAENEERQNSRPRDYDDSGCDKSGNRRSPIKGNVKRKILPVGSVPIFFSRHSAQPIERPLREWSCSGPKVLARRCVRSGESILLPCGSISVL